jgi:phage host-nuclease inhibitor protein Gam
MTQKITRIKKTNTVVPTSMVEAEILLEELSKTQNAINAIEVKLCKEINLLKKEAAKNMKHLVVERDVAINALFVFASPRKEELTRNQRTIFLSSGKFGWRVTPPRVELEHSSEDAIALLKKTKNWEFIRFKEEIDREALLETKPSIEGIVYKQNDEFFVVPNQKINKPKTITKIIDCI